MAIASTNPATGEVVATFAAASDATIEKTLSRAHTAFWQYRTTRLSDRRSKMLRAAAIFERDKHKLARLATLEMGKTLSAAIAEVEKCALCCGHSAENAQAYLSEELIPSNASRSGVRFLPLGPVLAVMPWNFPYWQVIRFAAPALMAGNVGVLKHASNVPQCAQAVEKVFLEAGFPEGCLQTLLIEPKQVAAVIADPRIVAVTLTGSEGAGASVAAEAGKHLKKCVLELGGSDPFIVMPSADLNKAAQTAVIARNINNGQSCIAAKRFIIHTDVYETFLTKFVAGMQAQKVGDPMQADTDLGPLATQAARHEIAAQVEDARSKGAKILCGGTALPGDGAYYAPTVIAEIPPTARVYREEVFGPVALVHRAESIDNAIGIANDSPFGLGSSVWTKHADEIEKFSLQIEAGQTFVNAMVASDPRLPFGGVKHSGYGRELAGMGMREFTNAKTIFIAASAHEGDAKTE